MATTGRRRCALQWVLVTRDTLSAPMTSPSTPSSSSYTSLSLYLRSYRPIYFISGEALIGVFLGSIRVIFALVLVSPCSIPETFGIGHSPHVLKTVTCVRNVREVLICIPHGRAQLDCIPRDLPSRSKGSPCAWGFRCSRRRFSSHPRLKDVVPVHK